MKFDIQESLTTTQYQQLKCSKNIQADLAAVLPKKTLGRIQAFLNDPAYLPRIVRAFKGKPAYLLLKMARPLTIVWMPTKLHRILEKAARKLGITVNQLVNAALRAQLQQEDGRKHS